MRKFLTLAVLASCLSFAFSAERFIRGNQADAVIDGAELIRYTDRQETPNYIRFKDGQGPLFTDIQTYLYEVFELPMGHQIEQVKEDEDDIGWVHYEFYQYFDGYRIEYGSFKIHVIGNRVAVINGWNTNEPGDSKHSIAESAALKSALSHVNANTYTWEVPAEERKLQIATNDPEASFYPVGEKVYLPSRIIESEDKGLAPVWKFDVFAYDPPSRADIFVNAVNGEVIHEITTMHHTDTPAVAQTSFSGQRAITVDYTNSSEYRLRESGRGQGISTLDAQGTGGNSGTSISGADIISTNNQWPDTGIYSYATDAHWGMEMSYDYLKNIHNRNGMDGNGKAMLSYVHAGNQWRNASWNINYMQFGDGAGTSKPYTVLDVCGHELCHGLTYYTAQLVYSRESGALNESFSDIFGACIEYHNKPDPVKNWLMGEDRGTPIRSMSNPNQYGDPDTYEGDNWWPQTNSGDNYGVHVNSGVQNFWFYLLSVGGNGVNDNGDAYSVNGIGITKAEKIAYRNLRTKLSRNSDFEEARFGSIEAAKELYGPCSPEVGAVVDAWHAVGLGDPYQAGVVANFSADKETACAVPIKFFFKNESNVYNINSYTWDFGDGNTSTDENPSHTYTAAGTYTVKLSVDGGVCGQDTEEKVAFIEIDPPAMATADDVTGCEGKTALITANVPNTAYWYSNSSSTDPLYKGNPFETPVLSQDETYYVSHAIPGNSGSVGPDTIIGFGGFGSFNQYLIFDVMQEIVLKSVVVYANGSKVRSIELRDSNGNILDRYSFVIGDGKQKVDLNFTIPAGQDYQLGIPSNASDYDLYRNSSNAQYPYTLTDYVTIKQSSAFQGPTNYYYYFYDWEIEGASCISERIPVDVTVDFDPNCQPWNVGIDESDAANSVSIYPNPTTDQFQIQLNLVDELNLNVELYDMNGKVVQSITSQNYSGNQILDMDVDALNSGIYMLRVYGEGFTYVERVIVSE